MKRQNTRFNEDSEELGGTPKSGYFLSKGREVPDADLTTTPGTYQTDASSLNLPVGVSTYGSLLVQYSGGDGVQIYTPNVSTNTMHLRSIVDGVWHPWVEVGAQGEKIFADVLFIPDGTINRSVNVSGIVDNGEGDWGVTYASFAPDDFLVINATPRSDSERFGNIQENYHNFCHVCCWNAADNSSKRDPGAMHVTVHHGG